MIYFCIFSAFCFGLFDNLVESAIS